LMADWQRFKRLVMIDGRLATI